MAHDREPELARRPKAEARLRLQEVSKGMWRPLSIRCLMQYINYESAVFRCSSSRCALHSAIHMCSLMLLGVYFTLEKSRLNLDENTLGH